MSSSYVTEGTVWPEFEIPGPTKSLISRFFELADLNSPEAGPRMASEVFTSDGVMKAGTRQVQGSDQISNSRKAAWDVLQARKHYVVRVYTQEKTAKDLLIIGELDTVDKQGANGHTDFCARCVVVNSEDGPKLSLYTVWVDRS